jgi:hypothetical protein
MDWKTRALGLGVGVAIALFAAGGAAEEVETLRGSASAPSPSVPVVWGGYGFVRRHDHRSMWRPGPRSWKHRPGHHHGSGHRVRGSAAIGAARVSFSHR